MGDSDQSVYQFTANGVPSSMIRHPTGRVAPRRAIVVFVVATLATMSIAGGLAARSVTSDADEGIAAFATADFGGVTRATLETNALPYKVVATALLMRAERARGVQLVRADLPAVFREFGFTTPERIANWPTSIPAPHYDRPLGMVSRTVSGPIPLVRIDAVNLGCTTCHAGLLYDASGRVTNEAWIGAPSTSINLEGYTQAVFQSLADGLRDQDAFRARIAILFPDMGRSESFTLRFFLMRQVAKRIAELQKEGAGPLPFSNGGAGRTNGVASLKHMLGMAPGVASGHPDVGFTSIPELSGRGFRSSLLSDGIYAPIGAVRFDQTFDSARVTTAHLDSLADIVAFFTVSTMGVQPIVGERAIPAMRPVLRWIGSAYRSSPFPGTIDSARMRAGQTVFNSRCSNCHGKYGDGAPRALLTFPNAHIEQSVMGTDSSRWAMVDSALLASIAQSAYERHMRSAQSRGYVAPILSGLWSSAPYLHNGSVPTLWQLMSPTERPTRFMVGGHALDYETMGIAGRTESDSVYRYPADYVAWSAPELFDTRRPGLSNKGHEREFVGLSAAQKWALIEYLKTL